MSSRATDLFGVSLSALPSVSHPHVAIETLQQHLRSYHTFVFLLFNLGSSCCFLALFRVAFVALTSRLEDFFSSSLENESTDFCSLGLSWLLYVHLEMSLFLRLQLSQGYSSGQTFI